MTAPAPALPDLAAGTSEAPARADSNAPAFATDVLRALLIGAVATVIALIGSWHASIWTDEAATITAATRSLPELWRLVQNVDAVHGAYYLFMHVWTGAFGISPFALRLPSALAVGIAAIGVYALARLLLTPRVAILSGVVFAVLPRVTWMGMEARSFGMSAMLAVWATVFLVLGLRRGRWWWLGYALAAGFGIAVNVYVALLLVAHGATVLWARVAWRVRFAWLGAAIGAVVVASPVIALSARESGQIGNNPVSLLDVLRGAAVNQWFLGETPTGVHVRTEGTQPWMVGAIVLASVGWALIALAVIRMRRLPLVVDPPRAGPLAVLLPWLVAPTLIVAGYSLVVHPMYNPRYFTFCVAPVAILIAVGIELLRRRWLQILALVLIAASALPVYLSQRQTTGKSGADWSEVAAFIDAEKTAGDGVYFSPLTPGDDPIVQRTTRLISVAYPAAFIGLDDITARTTGAEDGTLRGTSRPLTDSGSRLGGVDTVWVIRRRDYPAEAAAQEAAYLSDQGFRHGRTWTGPLDIVEQYSRVGG